MRARRVFLMLIAAWCWRAGLAQAGLYNTEEPIVVLNQNTTFPQFQFFLNKYRELAKVPGRPDGPVRRHYIQRVTQLEDKERRDQLSVEDRVNLSAYYVRLGQAALTPGEGQALFEKAIGVLAPIAADPEHANFMILANLGTAHHLAGRIDRASGYIDQALSIWPRQWPGLSRAQLHWYRRTERAYLNLLQLRADEETRLRGKPAETVDALFPRVRFVGPNNQYAAGEIASKHAIDLPADAILVVGQLVLWMPGDLRLYWLLGEILNASGEVLAAADVLDFLVSKGSGFKEVKDHRQVLHAARASARAALDMPLAVRLQLLDALTPRWGTLAPGAGSLANQAGVAAVMNVALREAENPAEPEQPTRREEPKPVWVPDVKHVLVSFLAGVVITLLGTLQYREIIRRRQRSENADASKT